jgi:NAD(P)-dependent dehydrogenase (short-subunit alcohol dehydrogenase family)
MRQRVLQSERSGVPYPYCVHPSAVKERNKLDAQDHPVAIVTGAASGIGLAAALAFARSGYRVFLVDRDEAQLRKVVEEDFRSFAADCYCGDVSMPGQVQAGLAACLSRFGQVDVLVANAAIMEKVPFLAMREEEWDRTIAVNLKGVFLWGQAVAAWLVKQGRRGAIINIACIRAELATEGLSAYIASKGGVKMLTKAMAVELAPYGIRVNAIEPGRTMTEGSARFFADGERRKRLEQLIPLKHLAAPEEIATVALFLASAGAKYMTGAVVPVDGGYTSSKE